MARLIPEDVAERNQGPWPDSEHATLNKLAVEVRSPGERMRMLVGESPVDQISRPKYLT